MTENLLLSNTFDNVSIFDKLEEKFMNRSFTETCITIQRPQSNGNKLFHDTSSRSSKSDYKDVSFDDSLFLTESFLTNAENIKTQEKDTNSEDIFSDSQELLKLYPGINNINQVDGDLVNNIQEHEVVISTCADIISDAHGKCDAHALFNENSSVTNSESVLEDLNKTIQSNASTKRLGCSLLAWGLPDIILQKYYDKKIFNMFDWQVECLGINRVLEYNANLVYSAPTSAGKTLVAEILVIKTVIERKKKVLFILPFVSVVREKMFYFQDILGASGIRVEGFMGSYHPPGGFETVQVAICTIEKANNLVNRMLEENNLSDIGAIVIDEMHLLGDAHRGYLLELLLTKIKYMCKRNAEINIQIIGMSATLPNLNTLADWLDAELYTTDFRPVPLYEQIYADYLIYDNQLTLVRRLEPMPDLGTDTDNILQLCLETICKSCSVIIFCPTKNWCENLAQQIAAAFLKLGTSKSALGESLRLQLNRHAIIELIEQLKRCPVGLDTILQKTVSYGVAFHHAGLTMDERDILEGAFRTGALRVLVATSTLSSGVNLPAQRVIIRTLMFYGKPIDALTYRQMIGRAGRMGKDESGESILICQKNEYNSAKKLMSVQLEPIQSCLESSGRLKRAILEVIASEVVCTPDDVELFTSCTLLAASNKNKELLSNPVTEAVNFLQNNEFIRLQSTDSNTVKYVATSLGKACLSSSLPPEEGLCLFSELEKARQCFVLENELHIIYLITPYSASNQWGNLDWMNYLDIWEKLPASMKRVGELVGVRESYIVKASRARLQTDSRSHQMLLIHKRFYTALALQDLVNEVPLNDVATKFICSRGMMQSLQQSASTFAGMVTAFSRQLGWSSVEILVAQFQDRLQFGVNRELLDLMKLPILTGHRARALYNAGIETLVELASSDVCTLENILHKALPFESEKKREGETDYDAEQRNKFKTVWVCGKNGLTEREAAVMLIQEARKYLELEMGLKHAEWKNCDIDVSQDDNNVNTNKLVAPESPITDLSKNTKNINLQESNHQNYQTDDGESSDLESSFELKLSPDNYIETFTTLTLDVSNVDAHSDESLFDTSATSQFDYKLHQHCSDELNKNIDNKNGLDRKRKISDDFIASSQEECELLCASTRRNKSTNSRQLQRFSSNESNSNVGTPTKKAKMIECRMDIPTDNESEHLNIQELEIVDVCKNVELFKTFCAEVKTQSLLSLSVGCSEAKIVKPTIGCNIIKKEQKQPDIVELRNKNRRIDGFAINWGDNTVYFINLLDDGNIAFDEKINLIRSIFNNTKIIRMFDAKEQLKTLQFCKLEINCFVEDPKVADWMLQPETNEKNLQMLAAAYSPNITELSQLVGGCKGVGSIGLNYQNSLHARLRASVEAVVTWHLMLSVQSVLIEQNCKLLDVYDTEMKTLHCLAEMEVNGIGVCKKSLQTFADYLKELTVALEKRAHSLAGKYFSLASTKQVAKAIGIYRGKRISVNKQALQDNENPVSKIVIQWRKLNSILTKMVYPLLQLIENQRIHPCCIVHTATGRITMHEPNLQNVARNFEITNPASDEVVPISCRSVFKSADGYVLLSADYCQLELRILSHLSEDKLLRSVMNSKDDVFKLIAAKWNNILENEVNDILRQRAKQICYGIIYGMGAKTLSKQMNVTEDDAIQFIETFHSKYVGIKQYIKKVVGKCKTDGYVETLMGRRRYLPKINHQSPAIKSQAERQAVNTTIQGSAADIAKKAMTIIADRLLKTFGSDSEKPKLVLHLHDELLYEVPSNYLSEVAYIVRKSMETSVCLSVPFPVKLKTGSSWGTLKEFQ